MLHSLADVGELWEADTMTRGDLSPRRARAALCRCIRVGATLSLISAALPPAAEAATTALTNYGASRVEVPTSHVYAFSASCAAVPCTIRLTKRAYAGGEHVREPGRFWRRPCSVVLSAGNGSLLACQERGSIHRS